MIGFSIVVELLHVLLFYDCAQVWVAATEAA